MKSTIHLQEVTEMDLSHVTWRKSSRSLGNGGECVEIGVWRKSSRSSQNGSCVEAGVWRKSSHSASNGGECVEISAEPTLRLARDSKNPDGSVLAFSPAEWRTFTETIKSGRLNRA